MATKKRTTSTRAKARPKKTSYFQTLKKNPQFNKIILAGLVIVLVIVGYFAFFSQAAATNHVALKASQMSVTSPATSTSDSSTISGKAITFNTGSTGGGGLDENPEAWAKWHKKISATTFWVGEAFVNSPNGSQACSAYDGNWASRWAPAAHSFNARLGSGTDCEGATIGGCDGIRSGTASAFSCAVDVRSASTHAANPQWLYFPTWVTANLVPRENPFYVDLPYDDHDPAGGYNNRCDKIPFARTMSSANCTNEDYSYMKNRWVEVRNPNWPASHPSCYAQNEDAGPFDDDTRNQTAVRNLWYKDAPYVFGTARPVNPSWGVTNSEGAGMDMSPALHGCLGYTSKNNVEYVDWRWVTKNGMPADTADIPAGSWKTVPTTSGVNW